MTTSAPAAERQFPCSHCGAALEFDPAKTALTCPFCGNDTPVPKSMEPIEELSYEIYAAGLPASEAAEERLTVQCAACGAQAALGKNVTSDRCVFCGSPVVAERSSRRVIKPRAMLPFAVARPKAQEDFHAWLKGLWFAPNDLLAAAECGRLNGVYLPFWTFDCDASTTYTGERGQDYVETETFTEFINGRPEVRTRQVTRTRWWPASGQVSDRFDDLLVMASASLPPKQAAHLEPWDLADLVGYADEYLAGFAAESYQVDLPQGFERAKQQAEPKIRQTVCRDIGGDHQRILSMQSQFSNVMFKHILLPLWISAYAYRGKSYRFLINARSGAVQGERPYSAWKIVLLVLMIVAIAAIGFGLASWRR
jgi:predicted RNA-binding Zn-ribbon protein involved in translation (DUF1610 family)